MNSIKVDHSKNVVVMTTFKNYLTLNVNNGNMSLEANGFPNDDTKTNKFFYNLFLYPLKYLLELAKDYCISIPNAKHDYILIHSRSNKNAIIHTAVEEVSITKLIWPSPHTI